MGLKVDRSLGIVLEECGFVEKERWVAGLMNRELAEEKLTSHLRYGALLKGASSKTDLVYEVPSPTREVPGTPCIYFKFTETIAPNIVFQIRKRIWNHGRIPTLWIVTPDVVRIYDSFARPQPDDATSPNNHLLGELHRIGAVLKNAEEFHKSRFDTGDFWRTGIGQKIKPEQRVDSALLRDLSATERSLVNEGLDSTTAHALLGRAIFVKYLEDRKILKPAHFRAYGSSDTFNGVLANKANAHAFFGWLRTTFNGDLFPLSPNEEILVQHRHLDILSRFLSGHDMALYPVTQSKFWPYSFEHIPIELISSIYEMFAHARDPEKARATSVHYTRFNLVELVLSLSMQNIKPTARVLDPACGSGAFLVEAFRRLAWLKAREFGRPLTRDELHQTLQKQIFGLDIDQDAIYVAAFSLYLALLEMDPDPQPPDALKLPRLVNRDPSEKQPLNLYVQDFFNTEHQFNNNSPFSERGFSLITGNPPWTALKKPASGEAHGANGSPAKRGVEYCQREGIPDNKPDQAFMWRARTFLDPKDRDARIAFVVSSRLLYQTSAPGERWRDKFLANNTISNVINLSDLSSENILFGRESSAGLPASVVIFSPKTPEPGTSLAYITPKWYPGIGRRDEILITSADIQVLSQTLLRENKFLWKTSFWGTPRDFRLVQRLSSFPTLKQVLASADIKEREQRSYGITFGKNPAKDASRLRNLPFLESGELQRYRIGIENFVPFDRPFIASRSNSRTLRLPMLVLNRALRDNRPCVALVERPGDEDRVIFDHMYYGISFGRVTGSLPYRLNAVLNSKCVCYLAFMLGASLGWDWRTIEPNTWMQIPLPPSICCDETRNWSHLLDGERWLRRHWQFHADGRTAQEISRVEDAVNREVCRLYDFSPQEIILVEDTIKHTILPLLQRKSTKYLQTVAEPKDKQLAAYANRVCLQLNGILYHRDLELTATVFSTGNALVRACRFSLRKRDEAPLVTKTEISGVREILEQMPRHLRNKIADHLYINRDLRVYDDEVIWVIKSNESRLWSETAALNDSDAIVREHMEHSPNGEW
jgi:hypothetical protein